MYGVVHDNGLIDIRPHDKELLSISSHYECDPSGRKTRAMHCGFIDVTYTPMSLEAGRTRSLVHGSRYLIMTDAVLNKALNLATIAARTTIDLSCGFEVDEAIMHSNPGMWIFHCCGVIKLVSAEGVAQMIRAYVTMKGHDSPSMRVFSEHRLVSLAVTPGCIMKPVLNDLTTASSHTVAECNWIDSLHRHKPSTYTGANLPITILSLQSFRTFSRMVPYLAFNQPPRPIMASNMAVQAMCQPKVSAATTRLSDAGLLASHCWYFTRTLHYNYEDAIIAIAKLNDMGLLAHEGFVYHPMMDYSDSPATGQPVPESVTWWRPYDESIPIRQAFTVNSRRAVVAQLNGAGIRVGDKLATHHGQKFTISRILPDNEMPKCVCATTGALFTPHVIVASSSVHNRVTPGQLYESWMGMSAVHRHDFNPIDRWHCTTPLMVGKNRWSTQCVSADYGIAHFWQLYHLVRDKQQYMSGVPSSSSAIRGRLRESGVQVGEMDIHAMLSLGLIQCLGELSASADVVVVQKVTEVITRMMTVKTDIQMTVYRLNGDIERLSQLKVPGATPLQGATMDDLDVQNIIRKNCTVATSWRYY
ncbi:hypothetical protein BDK51DRAFT_46687 [Blyttiomyces helicus]|uniref:DNA-directed RNA polymerase n=1 Tax=Blyttiomyces helicus TaxID=388810 RepID=A0A4P9W163_9FUNG|nr:hypothetical protein BDK51DRAFT_46687 [Blyttiomyces helicus]|eukprot:RKO85844.1 hypothetical protein BDK51DRAFT_46687 [Blyttiomyces helicus]